MDALSEMRKWIVQQCSQARFEIREAATESEKDMGYGYLEACQDALQRIDELIADHAVAQ